MSRRTLFAGLGAAVAVIAVVLVVVLAGGADENPEPQASQQASATQEATGNLETCAGLVQDEGRSCYSRELAKLVNDAADPLSAVEGITSAAYGDQTGFLLANCHGIMHTVAREYALRTKLTLAKLMDNLPRTNDPGCSAGYAHGLVTAVAPEIEASGPTVANQLCESSETRYQRYSCTHGFGHAFMRLNNDSIQPSLQMCTQLGSGAAADCSQGVYHDYWFAVNGLDDTTKPKEAVTDPRELCGAQPQEFVRTCWYRAFVETRETSGPVGTPEDVERLCGGLDGLQRAACVTGAIVIGPPDPRGQLAVCAALEADTDIAACIRGTKVQNLINYPDNLQLELIQDCSQFRGTMSETCYRWLGKTLGVLSDGKFRTTGCPQLSPAAARRACVVGVKSMEGPLVTFS
jgi:hypothetical protein